MPRISAESVDEHRSQVHHRIFAAVAELMTERSFDAITMAQIASRAEIGRTAIYHHFPDKEAVVVAFASHETSKYIDRLHAILDPVSDPVEQMRLYVRHNLTTAEQFHVGLGPQLYGKLSNESRLAIREHVTAVEDVLRSILDAGLAQGSFTLGDVSVAMFLIHACLGPRHLDPVQIEAFVLRGLGADA